MGIKVSRNHLVALLLEEPRKHGENPEQSRPAEPKLLRSKAWLACARMTNPQRPKEELEAYARCLHGLMQKVNVTKPWLLKTLKRRLYEK